jgi:hypothetical protein
MQSEPLKAEPPKRKRRWFQFSLRTLLAVMTVAAVGLFLIASFIVGRNDSELAVEAATARCRDEGWRTSQLQLKSIIISGGPLSETAVVTFVSRDRISSKTIEVTLSKTIELLPWEIAGFRELARN